MIESWEQALAAAASAAPGRCVVNQGWRVPDGWIGVTHDRRLPVHLRGAEEDMLLVRVWADGSVETGTYVRWMDVLCTAARQDVSRREQPR